MAKKKIKEDKQLDPTQRIEQLLSKMFGDKAVARLSDLRKPKPISTGSIRLDLSLKMPFPPGIHTIYGVHGAGKTTMSLEALGEAQKRAESGEKIICVYVAVERAINKSIVETISVLVPDGVVLLRPKTAEQCGDMVENVLKSITPDERAFIVFDSVAAMLPEVISSEDHKKKTMGKESQILTTFIKKVGTLTVDTNSVLILINQSFLRNWGANCEVRHCQYCLICSL